MGHWTEVGSFELIVSQMQCDSGVVEVVTLEDARGAVAAERKRCAQLVDDLVFQLGSQPALPQPWRDTLGDLGRLRSAIAGNHRTLQEAEAQETDVVDS